MKTLFDAPHNGIDTSIAAAASLTNSARDEARLMEYVTACGVLGATDHEIAAYFGWSGDYTRPRRWKWSHTGKLIRSEIKRPTPSGCMARAWVNPSVCPPIAYVPEETIVRLMTR